MSPLPFRRREPTYGITCRTCNMTGDADHALDSRFLERFLSAHAGHDVETWSPA